MRVKQTSFFGFLLNFVERVCAMPRARKRLIVVALDLLLLLVSVWLAFLLRIGAWPLLGWPIWNVLIGALLMMIPIFIASGVYSVIFRYAGLGTMRTLTRAFVGYGVGMATVYLLWGFDGVPRTIGVLQPLIFFVLVVGSRLAMRALIQDVFRRSRFVGQVRRILIYGAGNQGQQIASTMRTEPDMQVFGYLDDDERLHGQKLDGLKVHSTRELGSLIEKLGITDILLALPNAGRRRRHDIVEELSDLQVSVQTLPPVREIVGGKISLSDIRPVDVEDLLGRESVRPNELLLGRTVVGKNVMVTGAGGSIGAELCRQICNIGARKLVLYDHSEFSLYEVDQELAARQGRGETLPDVVPMLGSVLDGERLRFLLTRHEIDTVYHAAAYKHVPLVEANPLIAVRNNLLGTLEATRAAIDCGVRDFILISTDKAVRPTNVMGATKRGAEQILQAFAAKGSSVRFSMVRFGNVLGSSGSVVPLFRRQIERGGPVTVTHRDVTRYFMTIPEAASLVIQAGGLARGGEVFLLDMGEQMKIVDLARTMVRLSGLTVRDEINPKGDIEIVEIGLRPGEKLYEELLIQADAQPTQHPQILMAREGFKDWAEQAPLIERLCICCDAAEAIQVLGLLVHEFRHRRDDLPGLGVAASPMVS
jgi:FlaA1/EpsC-like NDP-sugar epimerase